MLPEGGCKKWAVKNGKLGFLCFKLWFGLQNNFDYYVWSMAIIFWRVLGSVKTTICTRIPPNPKKKNYSILDHSITKKFPIIAIQKIRQNTHSFVLKCIPITVLNVRFGQWIFVDWDDDYVAVVLARWYISASSCTVIFFQILLANLSLLKDVSVQTWGQTSSLVDFYYWRKVKIVQSCRMKISFK